MNDYKSEEFRTAKYLRSDASYVEYFNRHREALKKVGRGWWDNIEYIDEIIDNPGRTIYFVKPGEFKKTIAENLYQAEPASVQSLRDVVVNKSVVMPGSENLSIVESKDIREIEMTNGAGYYLVSRAALNRNEPYIWALHNMPVIHHPWITYDELFFNKEEAKDYGIAVTEYLQYNTEAVSAIARYF